MLKSLFTSLILTLSLSGIAQIKGTLLAHWSDSTLVASNAHDNTYNEVWGYASAGREYAIIGSTFGTHFFDVTDPQNMKSLMTVRGRTIGGSIIHRDYHNYGHYLYGVADEGSASTLQIMDLSGLPDTVNLIYDSNELIARAHNIFIDTVTARLYALSSVGATNGYAPMFAYDISQPDQPVEIGKVRGFSGYNVGHVHDAFVDNNIGYFNCGYDGLVIADVSDLENIDVLSLFTSSDYPQSGYNHSGWPTETGDYYYMADENHGYDMKVLSVADKRESRVLGTFNAQVEEEASIPHNQIVHNGYLYVSYYFDGLRVYDLVKPDEPALVMYYPTSKFPHNGGLYRGAWGVYPFLPSGNILVSDMQEGLFVIEPVANLPTGTVNAEDKLLCDIFPNPVSEQLYINIENEEIAKIEILDLGGQLIYERSGHVNGSPLDINRAVVKSGIYIVSIVTTSGKAEAIKIIVK